MRANYNDPQGKQQTRPHPPPERQLTKSEAHDQSSEAVISICFLSDGYVAAKFGKQRIAKDRLGSCPCAALPNFFYSLCGQCSLVWSGWRFGPHTVQKL